MLWTEPEAATTTGQQSAMVRAELALTSMALLILLTSYRTIVAGQRWIGTVAVVVVAMTVAVMVLRLIGLSRVQTLIVATVIEVGLLTWVFAPLNRLDDLAGQAWTRIVEEQAPVVSSRPVVFVVAAAFGGLVVLFDVLLRAKRGVIGTSGALLLCIYATPPLISGRSASPWLFIAVAALWLVIVRGRTAIGSATRRVRQAPAVIVAAIGLSAAVVAPAVLPDIRAAATSWGHTPPQVFGRGINPMLELGANLRRNSSLTMLTYRTELTEPTYLKVATLTDFTGKTWRPDSSYSFARFETGLLFDDDIEVATKKTQIEIASLRSDLLPVPYPATSVEGVDGRIRWERTGQTIELSDGADSRGQSYTVQSLEVTPTADQLRALPSTVPHDIQPFIGVDIPPGSKDAYAQIKATAEDITADEPTTYDKAKALQDYLRTSGGFQYSETAPVREGYDGNGIDVLAEFLKRKAGYCVHFSSAMAVMARSIDIPARIAVGYAPGSRGQFVDGDPVYTVRSENLHAWTEVWITGAGWLRFDPTTGVGLATALEEESGESADAADGNGSAPTDRNNDPDQSALGDQAAADDLADDRLGRSTAAAIVVIVGLLALPVMIRSVRRRWRLRPKAGANARWREVEDTARDLGVPVTSTQTARAFAHRLIASTGVDQAPLTRLLLVVETARYGRASDDAVGVADAVSVVRSLYGSVRRRERWRARLLPRSLISRRTPLLDHEV